MIFVAACFGVLAQACNPPVRLRPSRVETGLDSTLYVGVVEDARSIDLREARFLAHVKVGDLGVSLDCKYPDVLQLAAGAARPIGGNLLVITEHTRNSVKSTCHRIKADIYHIQSLEGLEPRINWHPARPIQPGDLRGDPAETGPDGLPILEVSISCRIGGDYFKDAILRTETIFWADSSSLPADAVLRDQALRRARLHFDLAELHARQLKSDLAALGPDVSAITGQYREMTIRQQEKLRQQRQELDGELAAGSAATVLDRWETRIRAELAKYQAYQEDVVIDLRKKARQ